MKALFVEYGGFYRLDLFFRRLFFITRSLISPYCCLGLFFMKHAKLSTDVSNRSFPKSFFIPLFDI